MTKIEKIDQEIAELKKELANVKGTDTEVYSRIVGYYRAVKNWNLGKKEEYGFRKDFVAETSVPTKNNNIAQNNSENKTEFIEKKNIENVEQGYLYFYRDTCPNCPPVKNFLNSLSQMITEINVDTEEGLNLAKELNIMATPTAIYFNNDGMEQFRGNTVEELKASLEIAC